jgi:hypothetical protein
LFTSSSQHDLGDQNRYCYKQDAQQVNQYKSAAAVGAHDVWKFPDIAQPDGRANCRQQKRQPG